MLANTAAFAIVQVDIRIPAAVIIVAESGMKAATRVADCDGG
jgi:hypothetical protein